MSSLVLQSSTEVVACVHPGSMATIFFDFIPPENNAEVIVGATVVQASEPEGRTAVGTVRVDTVIKGNVEPGLLTVRQRRSSCNEGFSEGQRGFIQGRLIKEGPENILLMADSVSTDELREMRDRANSR